MLTENQFYVFVKVFIVTVPFIFNIVIFYFCVKRDCSSYLLCINPHENGVVERNSRNY